MTATAEGGDPNRTPHVAIFSLAEDLHALVVRQALRERHGLRCSLVTTNQVSGSDGISWSPEEFISPTLPTDDGGTLDVRDIDLIWWRRSTYGQRVPEDVIDPIDLDVINNDCCAALLGVLRCEFRGRWISHPDATTRAENKVVQLKTAGRLGLRIPRTLVSQDPRQIRAFASSLDEGLVVKPVKGTVKGGVVTTRVRPELLREEEALRLAPAIYQEAVEGERHIRACCFGADVFAASIDCEELDWRPHLDSHAAPFALSPRIEDDLRRLLRALDLRMGIFDLKLNRDGDPVFLEVNPQGQFLFVQGMSGLDLESAASGYFNAQAREAATERRGTHV